MASLCRWLSRIWSWLISHDEDDQIEPNRPTADGSWLDTRYPPVAGVHYPDGPEPAPVPPLPAKAPLPAPPVAQEGLRQAAARLLLEAWEKASRPGAGTVYVLFRPDGTGELVETCHCPGGADIVIDPAAFFPLRPRPVHMASAAMLAVQDRRPFESTASPLPSICLPLAWPTVEAELPDPRRQGDPPSRL